MRMQTLVRLSLTLAAFAASAAVAAAESYPSGTVRFLVAGAAGTPPDILTRIVVNELSQSENWRVVTENKPGAMTTIASMEALRQPADGHTVMAIAMSSSVAPSLIANLRFRLDADFAPVIKVASAPHILVVHPAVEAASLPELVALLKRQPDKLTFSSGGFGTPAHMTGELFKLQAGVRATHVPYPGSLAKAIADLINGTNAYQFITPLPVLNLIATGKLRALAVTGAERMKALPEVRSVVEDGFPGLVVHDWIGFVVKRGTPDEIIERLNAALNKALANPRVREAFLKISADPAGGSADEFGRHISAQMAHWRYVVEQSGITVHK